MTFRVSNGNLNLSTCATVVTIVTFVTVVTVVPVVTVMTAVTEVTVVTKNYVAISFYFVGKIFFWFLKILQIRNSNWDKTQKFKLYFSSETLNHIPD